VLAPGDAENPNREVTKSKIWSWQMEQNVRDNADTPGGYALMKAINTDMARHRIHEFYDAPQKYCVDYDSSDDEDEDWDGGGGLTE